MSNKKYGWEIRETIKFNRPPVGTCCVVKRGPSVSEEQFRGILSVCLGRSDFIFRGLEVYLTEDEGEKFWKFLEDLNEK